MIRTVIYILLVAVLAMFYKTFYMDYHKKEVSVEANASVETPEITQSKPEPLKTAGGENLYTDEANRTGWQSRKGMPIDRLGDTIGDSLKDKIKVK